MYYFRTLLGAYARTACSEHTLSELSRDVRNAANGRNTRLGCLFPSFSCFFRPYYHPRESITGRR